MKILGRKPERYILGLKRLPHFLAASWRAFFIFKQPFLVIWKYLIRHAASGSMIRLRSGHVIYLSDDPADIVTVFLIFAREDYGRIEHGNNVIDIGANIGVFALFAAISGAKTVHAYEPSASSYEVLLKNIKANGFDSIVKAEHLAAVGLPCAPVRFPRNSDVMNSILPDSADNDEFDLVQTISLSEMVSRMNSIDLLKSDCEGAEYDIFLHGNEKDIAKISEIRMEYHVGPRDELISKLTGLGYTVRQFMNEGIGGVLWLTRNTSQ